MPNIAGGATLVRHRRAVAQGQKRGTILGVPLKSKKKVIQTATCQGGIGHDDGDLVWAIALRRQPGSREIIASSALHEFNLPAPHGSTKPEGFATTTLRRRRTAPTQSLMLSAFHRVILCLNLVKGAPMQSPIVMHAKTVLKNTMPGLVGAYKWLRDISGFGPARNRRQLNAFIKAHTQSIVASGPFAGMTLVEGASWGDGDVAPKLLGVYEQELHALIETASQRSYGAIVDLGCAEGYYAVGLARLFPDTIVYAFDTNLDALQIAKLASSVNGVADRIVFGGFCDQEALLNLCKAHHSLLVISDCEGYEVELFSDHHVRDALDRSDLIIECHDKLVARCTEKLTEAFRSSHKVQLVPAIGRNPNSFDFLADLHETDRWHAVCENRPYRSHWLFCEGDVSLVQSPVQTRSVGKDDGGDLAL
jgi:hypothetical protein